MSLGNWSALTSVINPMLPTNLGIAGAFNGKNYGGAEQALAMTPVIGNLFSNYKNYELQKANLQYQKDLQNQIFAREDNATQRRVNDLIAAGLSPTLAAGSAAGAGAVISTSAPQYDKNFDIAQTIMSLMTQKASIDQTNAQKELLQNQSNKINIERAILNHDYNVIKKNPFLRSNDFGKSAQSANMAAVLVDKAMDLKDKKIVIKDPTPPKENESGIDKVVRFLNKKITLE